MNDSDLPFIKMALAEAAKCRGEDDRSHPNVGAIAVRDGQVVGVAHRGELSPGVHAEYAALEMKLKAESLVGATVYTTLEPCTARNHPKVPCAQRLVERKVRRVVIGMLDPNETICGRGLWHLRESGIETDLFSHEYMAAAEELNREFIRQHRSRQPLGATALTAAAVAAPKDAEPNAEWALVSALFDAAEKSDFKAAEAALRELQERRDDEDGKERLQLLFWELKVKHAQDPEARAQLVKATGQGSPNGAFATRLLASLEEMAGNTEAATDLLSRATVLSDSPDDKASFALKAAAIYKDANEPTMALAALRSVLGLELSSPMRAEVLSSLGQTVNGETAMLPKAALLARAASLDPGRARQFSAGFALQNAGFSALSAVYYELALNVSPHDESSLNNLGVAFNDMSFKGMSIDRYRQAADAGNTLAMANLAQLYLQAGFYKEADEQVKKGRLADSPHEAIGSAMVALAEARSRESERWAEARKIAVGQKRFLNELADAIAEELQPDALSGAWMVNDSSTTAIQIAGSTVQAAWQDSSQKRQLRGAMIGKALFGSLEEWHSYWERYETKGTVCLILRSDGSLSGLLLAKDGPSVTVEWRRKIS